MGESAAARTERELEALRSTIDADLRLLQERVREDVDPRNLMRRNPVAFFGASGSAAAVGVVGILRTLARRSRRGRDADVDVLVQRMGGKVDQLRGKARKRFRGALRKELREIDRRPTIRDRGVDVLSAVVTSALTLLAQRFTSRLVADEELPAERGSSTGAPPPA